MAHRRALTNGFATVLNGAITALAASLIVHTPIPGATASDRYTIACENELLGCTACNGTTWTILERGVSGTVPNSHVDGSSLIQQLDADTLHHLVAVEENGTLVGATRVLNFTSGASVTEVGDTVEIASTGLVNPMTTAEDLIVGGMAGAPLRLPVGDEGQVLSVSAGDVAWADPAFESPFTTQDDLLVGGVAGVPTRLPKGLGGQALTVDALTGHVAWNTLVSILALAGLTDVLLVDVTEGDVLTWVAADLSWENRPAPRYEPLTNPAVPDLIFTPQGDVIMVRVA